MKDFFIAEYHVPADAQSACLLITDGSGRTMINISLTYSEDQKVVQVADFISGIYQVSLMIDGKVKGNSKIDLVK